MDCSTGGLVPGARILLAPGYQLTFLAAALAPRYPQLPLVVMSGYPRDEGEPLTQRPDVPFLQKPLAESQLLETVGALVQKRRRSA